MSQPLVSVVLPTYNRCELLPEAVDSVLSQTYKNFELLLIDDGSTDNTPKVLSELTARDDRIRVLTHDKNRGLSAGRNTGIEAARGKYIAFQDDDDLWLEEKLANQVETFENLSPQVGVLYSKSYLYPENIVYPYTSNWPRSGDLRPATHLRNLVFPDHGMVRRECFEKTGLFDEDLMRRVDTELWMRFAEHYHFQLLDEILNVYRRQTDSMTRDSSGRQKAEAYIYEKHRNKIESAYEQEKKKRLNRLEDLAADRPLVIWGSGEAGQNALAELNTEGLTEKLHCFIASHPREKKQLSGYPVYSPGHLLTEFSSSKSFVLVESFLAGQIIPLLQELGFQFEKDFAVNLLGQLRDLPGQNQKLKGQN